MLESVLLTYSWGIISTAREEGSQIALIYSQAQNPSPDPDMNTRLILQYAVTCRSLHLRRPLLPWHAGHYIYGERFYILLQYTVTCRSLHLRRPLLRLPADIYFIEHLPNCIVIIVFWVLEGLFILLARYTPSQPSAIYCVNRPHLYSPSLPTLIQAGFLTITAYCRLRIPDLRITPCHSTPPTQR